MKSAALAFVILFFLTLILLGSQPQPGGRCADIIEIAKDRDKIAYLKKWMSERLQDPDFMMLMNRRYAVRLDDDPTQLSILGVDWNYLGLNSHYGSVGLNPSAVARNRDGSTVKSVSVGEGRHSIIIKVQGSDEFGLDSWSQEILDSMVRVDDDVSVICR